MTPTPLQTEKLWTYHDLAQRFNVHRDTVYRWFRNHTKFRRGHTVRISEIQLQQFILQYHASHNPSTQSTPSNQNPPTTGAKTAGTY